MRIGPSAFLADPRRNLLALGHEHPDYTGPDRFAAETAAIGMIRDDGGLARTIGRAWRSGAPDDLLETTLAFYAQAHDLDQDDANAILNAARFAALSHDAITVSDNVGLMRAVEEASLGRIYEALEALQEDAEPCCCPACVAEMATLN